jgi:glycosyltransferase involved in cell wall biosynthesis
MTVAAIPLSAVLITRNAEQFLPKVLAALTWADDIIVVDSLSTDKTVAIAQAFGARVMEQKFLGFGPQKRLAIAQAKHDWVLNIDADEILDEEAQRAIQALPLAEMDAKRCFCLRRRTFIGEREIRYGAWNPDWSLRLFNRSQATFNEVPVHEAVQAASRPEKLAGSMLHYSFSDLVDVFKPYYARIKAEKYLKKKRTAGALVLVFRICWALFASFILKRGFLDGGPGVIVAMSHALNHSLGLALASAVMRGESSVDKNETSAA